MAVPHVSGVAALIKSYNYNISAIEIKNLIESTVDVKPSLNGKIKTGGRINMFKAINKTKEMYPRKIKSMPWLHILLD